MFSTNLLSAFSQIRIIGHMNDNMHGFAKPVPKDKHLASVAIVTALVFNSWEQIPLSEL